MQACRPPRGILDSIVASKRAELGVLRGRVRALERAARDAPAARDFRSALDRDEVGVIAECKRRSPGAGEIRPGLDPEVTAASYEAGGAAALSVLTDRAYFGGSLADLEAARRATSLPALRKDFTLDAVHLFEARAAGADAVLLIARILDDGRLRELLELARGLGMAALVEAHDAAEVDRAVAAGADVVGINNRDLETFTTDLDTTLRLAERVGIAALVVSESGIRTRDDVARLSGAGVAAVLVGEALLRSPDPGRAVAELAGVRRWGAPVG